MKVGDMVIPKEKFIRYVPFTQDILEDGRDEETWVGIVLGFDQGDPVVFWNEDFSSEIEYIHQLEVIQEV